MVGISCTAILASARRTGKCSPGEVTYFSVTTASIKLTIVPFMTRRSAEQTRQDLIDIGLELLHERGPSAAVAHIRLSSVLRRAGLTTGAAYRIWADQTAYQHDLALEAVRFRDRTSTATSVAAVMPIMSSADSTWQEAVRQGAEANLRSYPEDVAFLTTLAIRASSYGDADLAEAGEQRHQEALAAYSQLYEVVLAWSGRRLRPGFTMHDLATALAALSEGFGLQQATGIPEARIALNSTAEAPGTRDWSLLGVSTVALCQWMTEPDPDAAPFDASHLPTRWVEESK